MLTYTFIYLQFFCLFLWSLFHLWTVWWCSGHLQRFWYIYNMLLHWQYSYRRKYYTIIKTLFSSCNKIYNTKIVFRSSTIFKIIYFFANSLFFVVSASCNSFWMGLSFVAEISHCLFSFFFFSSFSTSSSCNFFFMYERFHFVYLYKSFWFISSVLFDSKTARWWGVHQYFWCWHIY